ncbi:AmpG family muropeptide MFS transporter [Myxococcota bacterium]|nr:AmpG family muropeptide MFS transporter [Myxococcota bacterium]
MSSNLLQRIFSRRMIIAFGMGFTGGVPLLLTGSTLQAWLKNSGADLSTLGALSLLGLPYTLKFLWAPLFDQLRLPFLGRRRGWLVATQLLCALALAVMSQLGHVGSADRFALIAGAAFFVTLFSASQDIVIDAYRRESMSDDELGLGSSLYVSGYRVAMLVSGAGALALADVVEWTTVYLAMAALMASGVIVTLLAYEPPEVKVERPSLRDAVVAPLVDYFKRDGAILFLLFIFFYKVGDQVAANMTMPLYLDLQYTKSEIALIVKGIGFWATILGGVLGGVAMLKLGLMRSLWIFGILQALSTLGFSALSLVGRDLQALAVVIGFENLTSGMGTAAFTAFMASLTNLRYTATQYALLSSFMGVPRVIVAAPAGAIAAQTGYTSFFVLCAVVALPGLVMIPWISKNKT